MRAKFEMRVPPGEDSSGKPHPALEYVEIAGHEPKDVAHRAATDADRERYATAYAEFKGVSASPGKTEVVAEAEPEGFFKSKGKK